MICVLLLNVVFEDTLDEICSVDRASAYCAEGPGFESCQDFSQKYIFFFDQIRGAINIIVFCLKRKSVNFGL